MNRRTFLQNPRIRGKRHHHHASLCELLWAVKSLLLCLLFTCDVSVRLAGSTSSVRQVVTNVTKETADD